MAARTKNGKPFKRLLILNQWIAFEIISKECSLDDPLPTFLKPFGSDEQDGCQS